MTQEGTSAENGTHLTVALAPHATWTETAGFPYGGTYAGYDAIAENVFQRLMANADNLSRRH